MYKNSFTILPAVDIYEGKCVRLKQGDYNQITVYDDDPVRMAKRWVDEGSSWLHVVDLEGARDGIFRNAPVIEKIAKACPVKIQAGGGVRSLEALESLFAAGVTRAVLGTRALTDPAFLSEALSKYGDKIMVSLDARKSKVATEGWLKTGGKDLFAVAVEFEKAGVARIAYTDISRDGMMMGPDKEGLTKLASQLTIPLIASGGISSPDDVRAAMNIPGVEGCIIGRALYEGAIQLREFFR